ncbi:unnamed protein product, partial [Larinioides sclopetarius]
MDVPDSTSNCGKFSQWKLINHTLCRISKLGINAKLLISC